MVSTIPATVAAIVAPIMFDATAIWLLATWRACWQQAMPFLVPMPKTLGGANAAGGTCDVSRPAGGEA